MDAAVTGGTGFVGQALVRLLASRGDAVRVLVRRPVAEAVVRALGAEPVRGDLAEAGGCDGLVRPGDVVFHLAARVEAGGRWEDFQAVTVEGTRRLLESALPRGPRRFVYVSSGAVYSPKHGGSGFSAQRTPTHPPHHNFYARAKLEAENLVRQRCEQMGCPWTIVRLSCTVYGPGPSPLFRYLLPMARRGALAVIGHGRNQFAVLYVDDAAEAILRAGAHPAAAGKTYDAASQEPLTQEEFLHGITGALGLPSPHRKVSASLAYVVAALLEAWARLRRSEPVLTRSLITLMKAEQNVDCELIRRELSWRPEVSFGEGTRRIQAWHLRYGRPGDSSEKSAL